MLTTMNTENLAADHAALIIDFLICHVSTDIQECLDMAKVEYEATDSALWLAVCDGLRSLIRQDCASQSERLLNYLCGKGGIPF